jgi:hypothetical protein
MCQENSSVIKIWQKYQVIYMMTCINLWQYLVDSFLQWEVFHTKFVEKIQTHVLFWVTFFFENRAVYEIM